MSASSVARCYVPRPVLLAAIAALSSCTDAATIMLKMKESAILRPKDITAVAEHGNGASTMELKDNSDKYNFDKQNYTNVANITDTGDKDSTSIDEESLSAVWYLAAFGGLVLFFFVVTCSELFFGNPIYMRRPVELPHANFLRSRLYGIRNHQHHGSGGGHYMPETPPPPYHLFAPPSYDDTIKDCGNQQHRQRYDDEKFTDVYVVPVHAAGRATTTAAAVAGAATVADVKLLAAVLPPQTKF